MARDYAQRGGPERRQTARRKGDDGLPGWVWLFAGVSIGGALVAFHYIGKPMETRPESVSAAETAELPPKPDKPVVGGKKDAIVLPPKEKPRFTFYEILPSQEVVIPRDGGAPKGALAGAAPGEVYYIQVASYSDVAEAEKQKAMLALLGVEGRIEKVSIDDNKATYYRVRIGPDKSLTHAQSMMARLADNGIDGAMLIKVK